MIEWILFIAGSLGIAYVSRASLRDPRSHGFYRFIAWVIILGAFLLNVRGWFRDPFSPHQIVSWILLCISPYFVIRGVQLLRSLGQPGEERNNEPLVDFEKTTKLVTVGVYRWIRHPLYSSLFFLTWGIFYKSPSWMDAGLAVLATGFLVKTARIEEEENVRTFGPAYREYMRKSKMFVPYLF
jgi:protein-S-isoprenylcysteine O-methyltransferase Ste14